MGRKGNPTSRKVTQNYWQTKEKAEPVTNPAGNPNCKKCRYANKPQVWAKEGTCNFITLTGVPRLRYYRAKECPGFPGPRLKGKGKI